MGEKCRFGGGFYTFLRTVQAPSDGTKARFPARGIPAHPDRQQDQPGVAKALQFFSLG
jgi:hypothetical protein